VKSIFAVLIAVGLTLATVPAASAYAPGVSAARYIGPKSGGVVTPWKPRCKRWARVNRVAKCVLWG
jgi:hypothetical protein